MKKLTYEFVKTKFEEEGYVLLSTTYVNAHAKLDMVCQNGHKIKLNWQKFKQGRRCKYCNGTNLYFEDIIAEFASDGYVLLTNEVDYVTSKQKLKYICPNGHSHSMSYVHWSEGSRCKQCFFDSLKISSEKIINSIESEGYTILNKSTIIEAITPSDIKIDTVCNHGHSYSTYWGVWQRGHRCKKCGYINLSIKYSGDRASNWQGGKSFEPYCEAWKDREYKQDIRNRDGNKCLNPYCESQNKNDLTIHHINYIKKDCRPGNLITVCRSCNGKANVSRKWHKAWYQAIMFRRYNYNY